MGNKITQDEERRNELANEAQRRVQWEKLLSAQKAEKANKERKSRQDEDRYFQEKTAELNEWKGQEKRKAHERREKALEDKRLQDLQRKEQADARKMESDQQAFEDAQMMKRLDAQMKQERDDAFSTLMSEKKKASESLAENERNLRRKAQQLEKDRAYDTKLAMDYIEMEKAKEAAREAALKATADKIQAKMNKGAEVKALADNRAKMDEDRAIAEQIRYAREKEEEEERRRTVAKKRTDDQMRTLKEQVAFRKSQVDAENASMKKQARIWKQQVDKYDKDEKTKTDARQKRNMQQQKWLENQIIDKSNDTNACDQSELELQMNKSLLAHINRKKDQLLSKSVSVGSLAQRTRDRAAEIEAQQRKW